MWLTTVHGAAHSVLQLCLYERFISVASTLRFRKCLSCALTGLFLYFTQLLQELWGGVWHAAGLLNPLTPELNSSVQRCLTRILLGILLLEPWISLIYAWKTNKCNNYSFSLLIMYGISYMFRHYITFPENGNVMPKHVGATIHN
jgi:hypothetical protein